MYLHSSSIRMKANTDRALRGQIGADRAYICRWCEGEGSDQTGIIDLLSRAFGPKESSSPSLLCSTRVLVQYVPDDRNGRQKAAETDQDSRDDDDDQN